MTKTPVEIIRKHCHPRTPEPTAVSPRLTELAGIRAVLFDIYGTMLISGAGDISLQTGTSSNDAFHAALITAGVPSTLACAYSVENLHHTIAEHHAASRQRGIEFPEVNISDVWQDMLSEFSRRDPDREVILEGVDPFRVALEYEVRINPVWPMPGLAECLRELRRRELVLGVVSNAQAMTPELFRALLGQTLEDLGFASELQFFSYQHGESKPGLLMFQAAAAELDRRGVAPEQTVYVGNDALNDIWAAKQVGFRTILFAGDRRSLRLRLDHPQAGKCQGDAVVTDLSSIGLCLSD